MCLCVLLQAIVLNNEKDRSSIRDEITSVSSCILNFTVIILYIVETRIASNVGGKRGKQKLNIDMMAAIKVATFRMYPLSSSEDEKVRAAKLLMVQVDSCIA